MIDTFITSPFSACLTAMQLIPNSHCWESPSLLINLLLYFLTIVEIKNPGKITRIFSSKGENRYC